MRPPDSRQHSSTRPNLVSGNRKRPGPGGTILDQLEPRPGRKAVAGIFAATIEPRWLFAGAGAAALLVTALAAIAWNSGASGPPSNNATPAEALARAKPVFESGPARIERVAPEDARAAETLLAQSEPPPEPLVVLPREVMVAPVVKPVDIRPKTAAPAPLRKRMISGPAAAKRSAATRPAAKRARSGPAAPPSRQAQAPDHDVDVISAIRKATESPAN